MFPSKVLDFFSVDIDKSTGNVNSAAFWLENFQKKIVILGIEKKHENVILVVLFVRDRYFKST